MRLEATNVILQFQHRHRLHYVFHEVQIAEILIFIAGREQWLSLFNAQLGDKTAKEEILFMIC